MRRCIAAGRYHEALCPKDCPWLNGLVHLGYKYPSLLTDDTEYSKNLLRNIQEYNRGNSSLNSFPLYLSVVPSTRCNLRCIMCPQDRGDKRRLPQVFLYSLKRCFKYAYYIMWAGGEILFMKEVRDMLIDFNYQENPYANNFLITNGTLLDEDMLDKLTRYKFINIAFSIDGATPQTYERIRPGSNYDTVMTNLKRTKELEIRRGENGKISWQFVVMKSNFHEIPIAIKIAMKLGVQIIFYHVDGNLPEENWYLYPGLIDNPEKWQSTLNEAKSLYTAESLSSITYLEYIEKLLSESIRKKRVVAGIISLIKDKDENVNLDSIIKEVKEEDLEVIARRLIGLDEFPMIKDVLSIFDNVRLTDPKFLYRTASFFEAKERYELAIRLFQRVQEFLQSKDYEEDDVFLRVEQDRLLAGVNYHLGTINLKTKNLMEAKRYLNICLEMIPDHRMAREYLEKIMLLNP